MVHLLICKKFTTLIYLESHNKKNNGSCEVHMKKEGKNDNRKANKAKKDNNKEENQTDFLRSFLLSLDINEQLSELGTNDHVILVHETFQELVESIIPFSKTGLNKGEKCILISKYKEEFILETLHQYLPKWEKKEIIEQVSIVETLFINNNSEVFDTEIYLQLLADEIIRSFLEGFTNIRAIIEINLIFQKGKIIDEIINFETQKRLHPFIKDLAVTICAFDSSYINPDLLKTVIMVHPYLLKDKRLYKNPMYIPPEEITGERRSKGELEHLLQHLIKQSQEEKITDFVTTLLNQTSLPYCVLDPLGNIVMNNESFSELIGYNQDELKKINFIEKITHPEYQLDLAKIVKTCSSETILQSANIPLIRKKDTVIPASIVRYSACDSKNNILFSYLFVNKIQFEDEILKESYKEKLEFPRAFLESEDLIFILETSKMELPGLFVEVNDVACQKLGFTKEEFISMSLYDIVDKESEKILLEKNNELLQKKQVLYSLKCLGKDKKEINLNFNSLLISSEEGIVELAIAKEAGEESKFKEEIIEERGIITEEDQLYLNVFKNSSSPMLIINDDFTIYEANLAFSKTFGYSSYDIVSKKITDFIKKNYLGEELPTETMCAFSNSNRPTSLNAVFIERAGEHKYVELKIGYIDTVKKCIIALTDITQQSILQNALSKSEMKYRELFQNARDLIFLFSFLPNGTSENIIEVNKVACETLGYTREELLEKNTNDIVDPDYSKAFRKTIQELQESGKARSEGYLISKNNEKIPIEFNSTLFQLEENQVIFTIARDIRKRKIAEEALDRELDINAAVSILSATLLAPTSPEEMSALVLKFAQTLTTSEFGFVGFIDQETGFLNSSTLSREIWDICEVPDKTTIFDKFTGLWGWVLNNKKSLLANSPQQHSASVGTPEGHIPIKKFLSVPALIEERLMGGIALANPERDYNKKDLEVIERLATIYAISLDREGDKKQIDLQNKYLNSVIESLSYPFLVINVDDYTVQFANKKAYGGELEEDIKCYQLTHKRESKCTGSEEICPLETIKETKQPMSVDHIHYDENKNPRYVEIHCSPVFDKDGKVTQIIESIVDVTEKKKTEREIKEREEKYRLVFDKASDAIFVVSITDEGELGNYIDVNDEACKRLGYSRNEFLEMTPFEITKPEQLHDMSIVLKELLEEGEKTFEVISLAKNGKEIPVEIHSHIIKLQDRLAILSISRDISLRKQKEKQNSSE